LTATQSQPRTWQDDKTERHRADKDQKTYGD